MGLVWRVFQDEVVGNVGDKHASACKGDPKGISLVGKSQWEMPPGVWKQHVLRLVNEKHTFVEGLDDDESRVKGSVGHGADTRAWFRDKLKGETEGD